MARAELEICDMIVNGVVNAKINRLDGIVVFHKGQKKTNDQMQEWNTNIETTLAKIEYTCQLIEREKSTKL